MPESPNHQRQGSPTPPTAQPPQAHLPLPPARNLGAFLRNLGGRARAGSSFTGSLSSGSGSIPATPAAKHETASDKLSSLLASRPAPSTTAAQSSQASSAKLHAVTGSSTAATVATLLVTSSDPHEEVQLSKRLIHALRIDASADPADIWEVCAVLLEPQQPTEVQSAGIEILKACISLSSEHAALLCYSYERQVYYTTLRQYYDRSPELTPSDLHALVTVLEALTRGGRDVTGLDGLMGFLTEIAMSLFNLRQRDRLAYIDNLETASTPLLDPSFQTPLVRLPPETLYLTSDPKSSPAALIIACHRFSFPHLLPDEVQNTLSVMIKRALHSLGEHEITKTLELVDTIVKFGYIPSILLEDVVKFVARTTGIEGRCNIVDISPDGQKRVHELAHDLSNHAHAVMRNLLRSPSNQALKHLRGILSTPTTTRYPSDANPAQESDPPTPQSQCQTPLLVGTLRCLRKAYKDYEDSEASDRSDQYPTLLAMGMTVLQSNLRDVLEWKAAEVDSEVLLFLEERFAAKTSSKTGFTFEEWEMVISILERLTWHIRAWEEEFHKEWSIENAAHNSHRKLPLASSKSDVAPAALTTAAPISPGNVSSQLPQLPADVHVLTSFSLVLQRMLVAQASENFTGSHMRFFDFLLTIARHLNSSAIVSFFNFYQVRVLASPGRGDWMQRLQNIIQVFFPSSTPYQSIRETVKSGRRSAVQLLRDGYAASQGYPEYMLPYLEQILIPWFERNTPNEQDAHVARQTFEMMERGVKDYFALGQEASKVYDRVVLRIIEILKDLSWKHATPPSTTDDSASVTSVTILTPSPGRSPDRASSRHAAAPSPPDLSSMAAQTMISIFYHSIVHAKSFSAVFAIHVFRHMLTLVSPVSLDSIQRAKAPTKTRLMVLQCLVRLRADQKHRVYAREIIDFEALAASIGRVIDSNADAVERAGESPSSGADASGKAQDKDRGRRNQRKDQITKEHERPSVGQSQSSAVRNRNESRSRTRNGSPMRKIGTTAPALWSYPDVLLYTYPPYPVKSVGMTGLVSFDHIKMQDWSESQAENSEEYAEPSNPSKESPLVVLPVSEYLDVLTKCLTMETDWELVSYILCAAPTQLCNKHFACGPHAARQLQTLRRILCDHLLKDDLGEQVQLPPTVKRSDMHSVAYQWLATLIAYRDLFTKDRQNEMVVTFMRGLSKTPNIAKPSIHALTMACYEFESAMSKYLPEILGALVRIMSTVNMPVHILELVASIGHIKSLYANFTEDDYKKVFALAVQYLSTHYEALLDDPNAGVVPEDLDKAIAHAFKQYVFLLSYYVIALWYTVVPVTDRAKYTGFIVQRLLRANEGLPSIDAATEVSLDMLARLAYSQTSPFSFDATKSSSNRQGPRYTRNWIIGYSVLSVEGVEGESEAEVSIRRPSGIIKRKVKVDGTHSDINVLDLLLKNRVKFQIDPTHQLTLPEAEGTPLFDADPAFFSLFLPPHCHINEHGLPSDISETDQAKRSLSVLDTMPHIDFHKIGVLYIGPGQTTEAEILQNIHGSKGYMSFLAGLGQLVRLKDCDNYTGGLDREADFDGKWTYIWSDEIQQIIFHVTTLMPTRMDTDPGCNYKKRHIGNDYVKIFFNESGIRLPFDIIPGQFNFINIIIEPHTPAGEAWRGAAGISNNTEFFRVSMQSRSDMPEIGPLGIFKMVSTASLPGVVRELALHANLFAQLFLQSVGVEGRTAARQKVEFTSTWRNRLQAIKRLKNLVRTEDAKKSEPNEDN